jgi:hypothetical protein
MSASSAARPRRDAPELIELGCYEKSHLALKLFWRLAERLGKLFGIGYLESSCTHGGAGDGIRTRDTRLGKPVLYP